MSNVRNVLLVGGNGFIGSHLIDILLSEGYSLRVVDWRSEIFREPLPDVEYIYLRENAYKNYLDILDGQSTLVYLAHSTFPNDSIDFFDQDIYESIIPFLELLKFIPQSDVKKIIFFSSGGAIYGVPKSIPVKEDHPLYPISTYGVSKAAMEAYLRLFCRNYEKSYLIVRPGNPFGPRQNYSGKQGVIPIFMSKIIKGEPITIWGDGSAKKDYIFVKDLAHAIISLIKSNIDNETFNISSGVGTSLKELIPQIEDVVGNKALLSYEMSRSTDVLNIVLDNSKYIKLTGDMPTSLSIEEGLVYTYNWLTQKMEKYG